MSGSELGRGPYPLHSHSLADKSVLFRTMLKQVADMLSPEDVESLAYIHSVQRAGKRETVTALGLFKELEAKGVFSADDVEPLEEILRGINRHDLVNTIVKEFKVKLRGVRRSGSDSHLPQHVTWRSKKAHVSVDPDDSSSHLHTTSILHSGVPAQAGLQPHPSSCPSEPPSLASMSIDERRDLLRSLMSDPDLRGELPSLLGPTLQASINPLLTPSTMQGDHRPPPASPPDSGVLTPEAASPTSPLGNGSRNRKRSRGSLSSEVSGRTSTSGVVSSPDSSLTHCLERQTSSSSQDGVSAGFVDVTPVRPTNTCAMYKLTSHLKSRTYTTWNGHKRMEWSVPRKELAQRIVCHSNEAFVKGNFSLTADGIKFRLRKPVSLVFKLYPCGVGKDEKQSLTLEIVVECRSSDLQALGMLNLTTTVSINQGREFISSKRHRRTLRTFTIHDFLPHEVVTRSASNTVDFAVETHITFDMDSPPSHQELVEYPEGEGEGNQLH